MANEKDANVEFSSYEIDAVGEILNKHGFRCDRCF